jgi:hypothetical protein
MLRHHQLEQGQTKYFEITLALASHIKLIKILTDFRANDHLIEFHLTEIDIFHLIEIVVIS